MKRHRNVWWWGAFLLGAIGLLLLAGYWRTIRASFGLGESTSSHFGGSPYDLRTLDGFGLVWTITRMALYFAAALLLVLGELRERLRSR